MTTIFEARASLVSALLEATVAQGFSREVARAGLEAEVAAWTPEAVAALSAELPPGWQALAPRVVLIIAARTLPASALRQCLLARLLGAVVHLKCAAGQEALGEALHALDSAIVPTPFASDDEAAVRAAIAQAAAVVVLGSDETVAAVRALTPADTVFAAHGHKVSAAWVERAEAVDARAVAADLVAWDQAGCLAPQVIWTDDPPLLAERVAAALPEVEASLPLADGPAHRVARQRTAALVAALGGALVGTPTSALATLPPTEGPEGCPRPRGDFRASPGPRIAWVLPADAAALERVAPLLSTLAVSGAAPEVLSRVVRRCAPGEMQRPPLAWRQDGLHPLTSLLAAARSGSSV